MRPIIYDFAMTVDGFICSEDGSTDGFVPEGDHVAEYLDRLKEYDAVLMGRATYEFGYRYGLKPGERAYPHMEHYIFSDTLHFDGDDVSVVGRENLDLVRQLKDRDGAPIYLCGGGVFAGWLLDHQLIDRLIIKLNPFVMGNGRRAFGDSSKQLKLVAQQQKTYQSGVSLLHYDVDYNP